MSLPRILLTIFLMLFVANPASAIFIPGGGVTAGGPEYNGHSAEDAPPVISSPPTPTPTSTPTPTPTPTFTSTPTPTPTPTQTPVTCPASKIYSINVRNEGYSRGSNLFSGSVPRCLVDVARNCGYGFEGINDPNRMKTRSEVPNWMFFSNPLFRDSYLRTDDCVAYFLFYGDNGDFDHLGYNPNHIRLNAYNIATFFTDELNNDLRILNGFGGQDGTVYLDRDCKVLSHDAVSPSCVTDSGEVTYAISPISLLWKKDVKLADNRSETHFPLDPENPGAAVSWYGSKDTPILVFDPKHTGNIRSATQLFGNFTFGVFWEDGYQALGMLDKDSSGAVDGREIDNLGLWFDVNQDGISDPGEVMSLVELDVTALYYKASRIEPHTGHIYADQGYERTTPEGKSTGASVDWLGVSTGSPAKNRPPHVPKAQASRDPTAARGSFEGTWEWLVTRPHLPSPMGGMLTFSDDGKMVSGHAYTELKIVGSGPALTRIVGRPIEGVKKTSDTELSISVSTKGNELTKSVVHLVDTDHIRGTSTVQLDDGTVMFTYEWVGKRVSK